MSKPQAEPGTLISGTLLPEGLIHAFTRELEQLDPDRAGELRKEYPDVYEGPVHEEIAEVRSHLIDDLINALNNVAPPGHEFSSHSGDGADFGFWPIPYDKGDEIG